MAFGVSWNQTSSKLSIARINHSQRVPWTKKFLSVLCFFAAPQKKNEIRFFLIKIFNWRMFAFHPVQKWWPNPFLSQLLASVFCWTLSEKHTQTKSVEKNSNFEGWTNSITKKFFLTINLNRLLLNIGEIHLEVFSRRRRRFETKRLFPKVKYVHRKG